MNEKEIELMIEIKSSILQTYDTLTVLVSAISSDTITPTSLIAPIEILQSKLMNGIVFKIDELLDI